MNEHSEAYQEGKLSFYRGPWKNPYNPAVDPDEYDSWTAGWVDAEAEAHRVNRESND